MRTTLNWVRSKFDNAFYEYNKYNKVKDNLPYQYNRAKSNLKHWGDIVDALERIDMIDNYDKAQEIFWGENE